MGHPVIVLVAVSILYTILIALLCSMTRFRERTLDDVPAVLRTVSAQILEEVLDVEAEIDLRLSQDNRTYRRELRSRLDVLREYTGRMAHNGLIVLQWGTTEREDLNPPGFDANSDVESQELIMTLNREGGKFRRLSLVYVARTCLYCLWRFDKLRFLPAPSVAALRLIGGVDFIEAYQRVVEAAAGLALVYGEEEAQELRSRMWNMNSVLQG